MNLIEKIKNLFSKPQEEEIKQIPVDTRFQHNRFKNIKIYAPDFVMNRKTRYSVQILDGDNNPIQNESVVFELNGKTFEKITDETGHAKLKISPKQDRKEIEIYYPPDEDYCPRVRAKLIMPGEVEIPDEIEKEAKIYAPNMIIFSKDEPDYSIRLVDNDNNPIVGEKLTIEIGDDAYEEITDEEGFVSLDLKLEPDTYTIKTTFDGNDKYNPTSRDSKLEIKVRNIDRDIMIEVNHLTMEFKVSKDKIDTLKEYVIRTLKRTKKENEKIRIIDDISFNIYKGERVGILGFNGAGKSTLLRIIAGIYEPTEGTIKINGKIAPLLELSAGFDKNYTGKNNVFLNGALLSMDENFIKEKYDEIVEFSELGEHINYPVKNYSKGMRAKLGFSIATLINPEILIIDEILAVGDIKFRKKSSEKIKSMMKEGVTVLLVSHSLTQIRQICDRCIWLENGQIYMEGETRKVCDAYLKRAKK
ncbi:ATP-binding cassette domain-containing protein [Methanobrevibacter sp.]|uniref:ATP-binding cassette domain-containing protein n=1 Tax=Methanobrevibacter sp. TaxID=66852 RepID=UPI003864BE25